MTTRFDNEISVLSRASIHVNSLFSPLKMIDSDDDEHLHNFVSSIDDDFDQSIYQRDSATSNSYDTNNNETIPDLLTLSSLMSHGIRSDDFLSSESRLIRSKFQRLFHFLLIDVQNEPMTHALGNSIFTNIQIDDALLNLNRNATLKFRNYKQFREQVHRRSRLESVR
jgi:hypothetical protein